MEFWTSTQYSLTHVFYIYLHSWFTKISLHQSKFVDQDGKSALIFTIPIDFIFPLEPCLSESTLRSMFVGSCIFQFFNQP